MAKTIQYKDPDVFLFASSRLIWVQRGQTDWIFL